MPEGIKILLVVSSMELGGGERMVLTLAGGLTDSGIHVEVAGPPEGKLRQAFERVCKAYHPFSFYPTKLLGFARFVAGGKFDVVHTHLFDADKPCSLQSRHNPRSHLHL